MLIIPYKYLLMCSVLVDIHDVLISRTTLLALFYLQAFHGQTS